MRSASGLPLLILRSPARASADLVRRVSGLVYRDLVVRGLDEIESQAVRAAHQENQYVRELEAHRLAALRVERQALFFAQPLEVLDELRALCDERHREILGRVEPLPVTIRRKSGEPGTEPLQ